jgi:hypothetical protein
LSSQIKFEKLSQLQPGRPGGLTPKEFLQLCLKELGQLEFASTVALTKALSDSETANWNTAATVVLGIVEKLSDTLTLSDAVAFTLVIPKTLSDNEGANWADITASLLSIALVLSDNEGANWLDALVIGYGQGQVDALSFSDSSSLGFGDQITDSLSQSDSEAAVLGLLETFSDQLVLSDAEVNLFGMTEALSDTIVFSDSLATGYGNATVDQLTFLDSSSMGYGDIISETLVFSDSLGVGYGNVEADSLVLSDSATDILGMLLGLSDSLNNWQDAVQSPVVPSIPLLLLDLIQLVDGIPVNYVGDNIYNTSLSQPGHIFPLLVVPGAGYSPYFGQQKASSIYWQDFLLLALDGNIFLPLKDAMPVLALQAVQTTANFPALNFGFGSPVFMQEAESSQLLVPQVESLSDQLVFSDSETLGYGNATVDSLAFLDANAVGYGDLIADTLSMSDSLASLFSIAEAFSDTLVLTDTDAVGYGNVVKDQLVLSDSEVIGYGQGTVDSLTFSDTNAVGYGDLISDSFTLTDSFAFNSGAALISEQFSDTLSLTDSDTIGYGQGQVDSLTFSDSAATGYGNVITDTVTFSDSEANALGMLSTFSDQLAMPDSYVDLLAGAVALSDTLTIADSLAIGYGQSLVDHCILSSLETLSLAIFITDPEEDSLNSWLDQFQFSTGQPSISLQFSDQIALSEALGAGYGNQTSEQNVMSDVMSLMESFEVLLAEATPAMVDALAAFMTQAMAAEDTIAFLNDTYSAIGSYLAGLSDVNALTDQFRDTFAAQLSLLLQDAEGAEWLDAVLAEFVFAPGVIRMQALVILQELVGEIKVGGQ